MRTTLTMTAAQHAEIRTHLLSDGLEAVALALCGRYAGRDVHRLLVREVHLVPYERCVRAADRVTWPTDVLRPLLERAAKDNLAILKIHGHPSGYDRFSGVDEAADKALFPSVHGWIDGDHPHVSAIMLPGGRVFGRAHHADGMVSEIDSVMVIGDDLRIWHPERTSSGRIPEFARRQVQAFGSATFYMMRQLRIAVVGCSGTGSIVVEQLARNGVGHLVLVDPDRVEEKNLNRIINAHAHSVGRYKVDVLREFVEGLEFGTKVESFATDLSDPEALQAVAGCDIVVGCMDSVDGRHLLNRLATFYLLPYFDVGVRLEANGAGGVGQVCGSVHFLQPGRSSLLTRRLYTLEQVRAAALKRSDPQAYAEQLASKYISGVAEDRPAVISVNMFYASLTVLDLLARLHPYRDDPNDGFAIQTISLTGSFWRCVGEGPTDEPLAKHVGRGDMVPMLDMPLLSVGRTPQ